MNYTQELDRAPFYYEKIEVAIDAVSRLDATYRDASNAVNITVEDSSIRYRIEGGDPDANDGHLVYLGQSIYFANPKSIKNFRAIAITDPAILIVTFYK